MTIEDLRLKLELQYFDSEFDLMLLNEIIQRVLNTCSDKDINNDLGLIKQMVLSAYYKDIEGLLPLFLEYGIRFIQEVCI